MATTEHAEVLALRAQLDDATARAERLRSFVESISSELELEPLLTRTVASAVDLLGARYGSIGLVIEYPEGPVVRTVAVYNMPPRELGSEMPPGVGLAGAVLQRRQPVWVERYGDLATPPLPELATHTVIGVPIWRAEQMIGFYGIGTEPPQRFSAQDVELLELFARHTAITIENARLFAAEQRRSARTRIIARIGQLITSQRGLDELLQTTVDAIDEQLRYPHIAIFLVDPEQPDSLVLRARAGSLWAGRTRRSYRQPFSQGLLGAAARSRRRLLLADVRHDPRYLPIPGADQIRSELVLPIVVGEQLLGVLNIESEQPISEEDAGGLAIVADQLGVAIDNAMLLSQTRQALEETRLLLQTSTRMSTAMGVEEVIAAYLEQVAARGRYACSVVLYAYDSSGQRSAVILRGRWTPADGLSLEELHLPYTHDALDLPLDAGQTVTIRDVHSDPRVSEPLRAMQAEAQRPALAMIPLLVRGQRIGLVVLSNTQPHDWADTDLQLYQVAAAQLAAAIDSRLQHRLLIEGSRRLAVLEERSRLARELHDSVTQSLFSMSLLTQALPDLWEIDRGEAADALRQVSSLTRGALAEMRALLFELRPAELDGENLVSALRRHTGAFQERTGIRADLQIDALPGLPALVEQALFRIAQESLSNIARHAHARSVKIRLQAGPPLRLSITDDGRGFEPAHVGGGHFGLTSMRERAAEIGALLILSSTPGSGTQVLIEWPGTAPAQLKEHGT